MSSSGAAKTQRVEVVATMSWSGPMRAAIVISPDATDADIRAAIPQALELQARLVEEAWPSGTFVQEAAALQSQGWRSYAELAKVANFDIWRDVWEAVQLEPEVRNNEMHANWLLLKATFLESAKRRLVAIRGKRAADACHVAIQEAFDLAQAAWAEVKAAPGRVRLTSICPYALVDEDMIKKAIRRHRRRVGGLNSPDSAIPKK